jgi:hypothetical protein
MCRGMEGVIILHSLNKYFIEWGHNEKKYERCLHTPFTQWSIYWVNEVWWHLSYFCTLWPHCMNYLLSEWSMMTPFISLLIVTSLYEVFIEWMEYDDTFHTSSHCDLTVWSIYWVNGVWWHLSYFFSLWPHCMKYLLSEWSIWQVSSYSIHSINTSVSEVTMCRGMKGVTILHSLNKYFIQWGHNEKKYERCHHTPFTQ